MDKIKDLNEIYNGLEEKNFYKLSLILKEYEKICDYIILFIYQQDFSKKEIRNLKNKINELSIFQKKNISNKDLFKIIKKLRSQINKQSGGSANLLPSIKPPGLFYENPSSILFTRNIINFSFILDILGFIPKYGVAADLTNFLLSFIRGEYTDAFFSLISAIPTVGSFIGVPAKYIRKLLMNKKKDYRYYYKTLISLKNVTKELRSVEIKNLDLDNPMNTDYEYDNYSP